MPRLREFDLHIAKLSTASKRGHTHTHHVASLIQTTPLLHFDRFFGSQEDYSMSADFLVERIAWDRNHETAGSAFDLRE